MLSMLTKPLDNVKYKNQYGTVEWAIVRSMQSNGSGGKNCFKSSILISSVMLRVYVYI